MWDLITLLGRVILQCEDMNKEKIKDYIIVIFLFFIPLLFLGYKGVFSCGFHLTDDHEIVNLTSDICEKGYFYTLVNWIKNDFQIRFRPVYWIVRVLRALLFGNNIRAWHICISAESSLLISLGYIFARKMRVNRFIALIFSFIYLLGDQVEVLWRLGPQEGLGCVLFLLALLSAIKYHEKHTFINGIGAFFLILLMMGTKESFLLVGISMILFVMYLEYESFENIFTVVKRNVIIITAIVISTLCGLLFIVRRVGLLEIGYAGIDYTFSISAFLRNMYDIWSTQLNMFILFLTGTFLLAIYSLVFDIKNNHNNKTFFIVRFFIVISFLGYSLFSQSVLYAKSGMQYRYKLPTVLIIMIFCLLISNIINDLVISNGAKNIIITVFFIYILFNSNFSNNMSQYVFEGKNTTDVIERVSEMSNSDTKIIVDWGYEWDYAASIYFEELHNIYHVYNLNYSKPDKEYAVDGYGNFEGNICDISDADIFITHVTNITEDDTENMELFGNFAIVYK